MKIDFSKLGLKNIYVALHTIDFRKQWNGLEGEGIAVGMDFHEGDCIVFVHKNRTQLRALWFTEGGKLMLWKKVDRPEFKPKIERMLDPAIQTMSRKTFFELFFGYEEISI